MKVVLSKVCFKCGAEKPLFDFYKQKGMKDGHLNKCKGCTKAEATNHREKNLERVRDNDKARAKLRDPDVLRKRTTKYNEKNPVKVSARTAVGNAVRDGRLLKPKFCERCGKGGRLIGHHNSYSPDKWLVVEWVCSPCHSLIHKELAEKGITL